MNRNPFPAFEVSSLPRLPIPPLEDTLARYLTQVHPLLTPDEFQATKKHVQEFLESGVGKSLHEELQRQAAETPTSWLEGFWDSAYLEDRGPAPINVNPFFLWSDVGHSLHQIERAAALTHSSLKFYELIRQQTLPADMERTTPLCMTQFGRLFATTRIPNAGRDKLLTYADSKHVIVLRGGFFWELQVIDGRGGVMSREQLTTALQSIVEEFESFRIELERNPEQEELRVGLLTTEYRETWAKARAHLLTANQANVTSIDTALFILCLDSESDSSFEVGLGTGGDPSIGLSMADVSRTMLHAYRGRNRWFDKLQLIVMANGKAGINMEHSPYDGHTVLSYATRVHEDIAKISALPEVQPLAASVPRTPKRLSWTLDATSRAAIQSAQHEFDAFIMRTESSVLEWSKFGKNWIVAQQLSPDAFVQMAYQLAYYLLTQQHGSTYESCQTKRFFHGRTETIRGVSAESVAFCRAFTEQWSTMSVDDKFNLLKAATECHSNKSRAAAEGKGVDRHLYGMYLLAKIRVHRLPFNEIPALFRDPAYSRFSASVLSTSNCGGNALDLFGFGPVVAKGLGLGYMIKNDRLQINITSFVRQARKYSNCLATAFLLMHRVCEERSHAPPAARSKPAARL